MIGPEHPAVAKALNNLAGLYDNQGGRSLLVSHWPVETIARSPS